MKILIDIYKTKDLCSGLGQYSLNFARELLRSCPADIAPVFLTPGRFKREWLEPASDSDVRISQEIRVPALPGNKIRPGVKLIRASYVERYLPFLGSKYDLWHCLHQFPSHYPPPSSPFILTVHDLNFLSEKNTQKAGHYLRKLQRNADRACGITVVSKFTEGVLKEHIRTGNKPVKVIHDGVSLHSFENISRPGWLPGKPFFFSISVFKEKKNFHLLPNLMKYFPDHILVLAGNNKTANGENIRDQVRSLGLEDAVLMPGAVSEQEKFWLYRNCRAFLFPSAGEGFGLPVIEAMLAGKPVFLSAEGSLPEVGGEKAFYWQQSDPDHMAEVITSGMAEWDSDPVNHASDIKKYASRFSWETCVKGFLELYREICA